MTNKLYWKNNCLHTPGFNDGAYNFGNEVVPEKYRSLIEKMCVSYALCACYVKCSGLQCADDRVSFNFEGSFAGYQEDPEVRGFITYDKQGLTCIHRDRNFRSTRGEHLRGPWDDRLFG